MGAPEVRAQIFLPSNEHRVEKSTKTLFSSFSVKFTDFGPIQSANSLHLPASQTPTSSYPLGFSETLLHFGNRGRDRVFRDFQHFYRRDTLGNFGLALLAGGILANTKMDHNFQKWYQRQICCSFTDDFSEFSKIFGEGKIFIPIAVTTACVYRFHQEKWGKTAQNNKIGDFFDRTARGYAVGTPTLLLSQVLFGGDRPRDGSSYWKPFGGENHTVSGHAFIGAVPFITFAYMSERLWVKGVFYTLSTIPAWSRVNDNAHYLSQSILGWYLAWISVRAVSETEGLRPLPKGLAVFPVTEGNYVGFGFQYRR